MHIRKVTVIIFMYLLILFLYFILVRPAIGDVRDVSVSPSGTRNSFNHTCICVVSNRSMATTCNVTAMDYTAGSTINSNVDLEFNYVPYLSE